MQVEHCYQQVTFLQAFYSVVPGENSLVAASVFLSHSLVELTPLEQARLDGMKQWEPMQVAQPGSGQETKWTSSPSPHRFDCVLIHGWSLYDAGLLTLHPVPGYLR